MRRRHDKNNIVYDGVGQGVAEVAVYIPSRVNATVDDADEINAKGNGVCIVRVSANQAAKTDDRNYVQVRACAVSRRVISPISYTMHGRCVGTPIYNSLLDRGGWLYLYYYK